MAEDQTHPISRLTEHSAVRFVVVGVLALVLLVPLNLITELSFERESFYETARQTVQSGWGDAQLIAGPMLRVAPRILPGTWQAGGARHEVHAASEVDQTMTLEHEMRGKGIFDIPVYTARLELSATFDLAADRADRNWENAQLYIGLGSTFGLRTVSVRVNGEPHTLIPVADLEGFANGFYTYVDASRPLDVRLELTARGAGELRLLPTAQAAHTRVQGTWPHPSVTGRYLPDALAITSDGFAARWQRGNLGGNLPRSWTTGAVPDAYQQLSANLSLHEPVSVYRTVQRSAKYGVLFVAVTFLTLLCFELSSGWRFHLMQYAATGSAMLLFFLTLLALAEHVPFLLAYLTATVIITALNSWYVWRITTDRLLTGTFAGVLTAAYATLFTLLRLEAFALLAGALLLLLGLAALMWNTQRLAAAPGM